MDATEGHEQRGGAPRVRVERRVRIRRMKMRRASTRRLSIEAVAEERRHFDLRRMSKRRALSRRREDRRRGIDRRFQSQAYPPPAADKQIKNPPSSGVIDFLNVPVLMFRKQP